MSVAALPRCARCRGRGVAILAECFLRRRCRLRQDLRAELGELAVSPEHAELGFALADALRFPPQEVEHEEGGMRFRVDAVEHAVRWEGRDQMSSEGAASLSSEKESICH